MNSIHWRIDVKEASGKIIPTQCSAYTWDTGFRFNFRNYRNHYYFELLNINSLEEADVKQWAEAWFLNLHNRMHMYVGKCIRCERFRDNILDQFCPRCMEAVNNSPGNQEIDYLERLKRF